MRRQANKTGPENLVAAERKREALDLRRQGLTYSAIGERLNISHVMAHKYVKGELDAINSASHELAAMSLEMELQRLDAIHVSLWRTVFPHGDNEFSQPLDDNQLRAIDRLLKIQERRAKLLGLDAQTKPAPALLESEGLTPESLMEVRKAVYGD